MDYNLLEDEIEIIEVFEHELSIYGYKGFCSFDKKIDNGYYFYKENNYWIEYFLNKGLVTRTKKYTNLYNLCKDILLEFKIDDFDFLKRDLKIPRGTNVIITKSIDCPIDEIRIGVIINSSLSNNKRHSERVYQVMGKDGQIYEGVYGLKLYSDICLRTMEDYIQDSEKEIIENNESIKMLRDRNWELVCSIQEIKGEMDYQFGDCMRK